MKRIAGSRSPPSGRSPLVCSSGWHPAPRRRAVTTDPARTRLSTVPTGTSGRERISRTEARWSASASLRTTGMGITFLTDSVNRNGEVELDQEISGRYQVNPDCSGMLLDENGEEWARLVIVKGGKSVYVMSEHNPYYVVATRIDKD